MGAILPRAESRALAMFNGLHKTVKVARRLDGRINNLRLFTQEMLSIKGEPIHAKGSLVEWQDHPDTQLLLMRRDRFTALQADIANCQRVLSDLGDHITPEERLDAMKSLASLRKQEEAELTAMSDKLDVLRVQQNKNWQMVGRMLTDMAKLKQVEAHFRDRLEFDKREQAGLSAEEQAVIDAIPTETKEREL